MNTTENNKIIAEFMGFESTNKCVRTETGKYYDYHSHPKFSCIKEQEIQIESQNCFGLVEQDYLFIEDLKFHSDWNWLMQVVEKIESLDIYYDKYIDHNSSMFTSGKIELSTKIEVVYNACIVFIKWYNQQI